MLNDEIDIKEQNSALLAKLENEKLELQAKLKGNIIENKAILVQTINCNKVLHTITSIEI